MREALRKLGLNKRYRFEATFSSFATKEERIQNKETILLLDVKKGDKLVADHLWLCGIQEFKKLNLKDGDLISFTARITMYRRFKKQRKQIDFGLINPMNVYKVKEEVLKMTENKNLVTKLYVTNTFKLEVNIDLIRKDFWLTKEQLITIFDIPTRTLNRYLSEIEKGINSTLQTSKMAIKKNGRKVNAYNLYFFEELIKKHPNEASQNFKNSVNII